MSRVHLRHKLGEVLNQVANKRERFLIKRSGIPAAILLRVSDYEDLQDLIDTWYEQQDRRDLRRIEARSAALTCMVSGLR
jgi:PHD/YefM family antitoxin component YafN of YafNO toxin-antitoxin module